VPVNSTTSVETVVSVVAEARYAFSPQDTLAVLTAIPTGGTVVQLPAAPSGGDAYEVADGDGSCSSGSPITVTAGAGQTIQGGSTLVLSSAFAWARMTFLEPLRAWVVFEPGAGGSTRVLPTPLTFTTIYVDPADESGHASDANPGTDPAFPILSTAHLNALIFLGSMIGDTLIQYESDDLSGTQLDYSTLVANGFALSIAGTPQVLHSGGTLAAGTVAIDPATQQRQTVHTSDLASFVPYVVTALGGGAANPTRVNDTTTHSGAWVMSAATPATPDLTRPISNASFALGALTIGDPYTITRGSILSLAPMGQTEIAASLQDFALDAATFGSLNELTSYLRCTFLFFTPPGDLIDCMAASDFTVYGGSQFAAAGGAVCAGCFCSALQLTADVYITGTRLLCSGESTATTSIVNSDLGGNAAGIQLQDCAGFFGAMLVGAASQVDISDLVWGTGNTGAGVLMEANGKLTIGSTTVVPTVTGAQGDLGFATPPGGGIVNLARAWDEGGGAYTTARATTWANFAAALGAGGLDYNAHYLSINAHVVTAT
jgi:hypothetical protein